MICIVPARKGSKGLKGKNHKLLNGKPLILHTILTAQKSKQIKEIILTTNDEKVIKICKDLKKVKILFKRPETLSKDNTMSIDVYLHAIKFYEKIYKTKVPHFCSMLPTCPVRSSKDIDQAIKLFKKKKPSFLLTVKQMPAINFQFSMDKKFFLKPYKNINMSVQNRQELLKNYAPNGSLYIFNHQKLKKLRTFMTKQTILYEIKNTPSFDIDDINDFNLVKRYLEK